MSHPHNEGWVDVCLAMTVAKRGHPPRETTTNVPATSVVFAGGHGAPPGSSAKGESLRSLPQFELAERDELVNPPFS